MSIPAATTTPATCGIMAQLNAGTAFSGITSLASGIGGTITQVTGLATTLLSLPNLVEGILLSDVQTLANNLTAVASGALTNLVSHVAGAATSLVNDLSLAIGQAAAQAGLGQSGCGLPSIGTGTPQAAECGNMQSLFGSISGLGATIMGVIGSAVSQVASLASGLISGAVTGISAALSSITGAISSVVSQATAITSMIASEVAAKAAMLTDMLSFGAANALQSLFQHPCAQPIIQAAGSPGLISSLNS